MGAEAVSARPVNPLNVAPIECQTDSVMLNVSVWHISWYCRLRAQKIGSMQFEVARASYVEYMDIIRPNALRRARARVKGNSKDHDEVKARARDPRMDTGFVRDTITPRIARKFARLGSPQGEVL